MNSGKVRLLCVIPAMTGGGAERVCLNLLRHLDYARYQVLLVCFNKEGVYLKKIPPDVQVVDLTKRHRYDIFRLIRDLRRLVDSFKPQVVMSLMHYTNIVTTLALWGKHPGLILCEHNYPPAYLSVIRMGKMKAWLMRLCYPRADKIVAISPPIRDFLINTFHVPEEKVALIANPVPMVDIQVEANERISHPLFENKQDPWFIAVGRLTPQKRFDRLIEAFALVRQKVQARLIILGQGDLLFELEQLAEVLGVRPFVHFVGFQENPHAWIARADVLVLSSDYEGFPMVILEGMACARPVVSLDCPSGPREVIVNGKNGILVNEMTPEALAEEMQAIFTHQNYTQMGAYALETAGQYDVSRILPLYEDLFQTVKSEMT